MLARLLSVLAIAQFGLLTPFAMATPAPDGGVGSVWCGHGVVSAEASAALQALAAAIGDDGASKPANPPPGPYGGPCHSCPAGCAGAVAPMLVGVGARLSPPLERVEPGESERASIHPVAHGPPLGGRAPPLARAAV